MLLQDKKGFFAKPVMNSRIKSEDTDAKEKIFGYPDLERRVENLLRQMTIEEKAGLLFSPQMDVVPGEKIATKGGFNFGGDVVKQIWKEHVTYRFGDGLTYGSRENGNCSDT